ncbi:MAG: hypothetical protein V4672_16155 [Verrucomicrobiota bacterium]
MSNTLSDNPAERAMITTLRVWFTWPLSGAALLVIVSLFQIKLGISGDLSLISFLAVFAINGLIHVVFLLRSGLESVIVLRQKESRRQGFIALVMVLLTFLICLVIGFFFLMMATGLSP